VTTDLGKLFSLRASVLLLASALLPATALTIACGGPTPPAPAEAAATPAESGGPTPVTIGAPKIAADEPIFDFGAIGGTDAVVHVFKIHNVGDADLKVERVQKT
jgi:hypothetical protein